mgnify:CR=1 FL=1
MSAMRLEHDLLGELEIPAEAYWGIHTARAVSNFPISGVPIAHYRSLIRALALVKEAAADANFKVGELDGELHKFIVAACREVAEGNLDSSFVVDAIQGGAGTSTNMNANEVIANRALELAGYKKGDYEKIHPLNHVNMSQSTNDVYPTALKVALIIEIRELIKAMDYLRNEFAKKATEFRGVIKMGRTQLQDAVPMTLGQEFAAFARMTMEDEQRLRELIPLLCEVNLGGTAIGTQLNAPIGYVTAVTERLSELTKIEFESAADMVEATLRERGLEVYQVSAATHEGLNDLLYAMARLIKRTPKESTDPVRIILRPRAVDESDFTTFKNDAGIYVVQGIKPERWVRQTNFSNAEAIGYLADRLARLGVEKELFKLGARGGSEVQIGLGEDAVSFDWEPTLEAGAEILLGPRGQDLRLDMRHALSGSTGSAGEGGAWEEIGALLVGDGEDDLQ